MGTKFLNQLNMPTTLNSLKKKLNWINYQTKQPKAKEPGVQKKERQMSGSVNTKTIWVNNELFGMVK